MRLLTPLVILALSFSAVAQDSESKTEKKKKPPADDSWKEDVMTGPPGEFPMLEPCQMTFNVGWNGVLKAGQADVVFDRAKEGELAGSIEAKAKARSTGAARLLWKYDGTHQSNLDPDTLRPVFISQKEVERKETVTYDTEFMGDFVFNKRVTTKKDGEAETKDRVFEYPGMYDLISSVLYIRSQPMEKEGETYKLITFPFDNPYLITLTQLGKDPRKFEGKTIDAIKFDLDIQKINKNGSLKSYKDKIKSATVWISDDDRRLPLELRSEVFVGSIRATLAKYEPLEGEVETKDSADTKSKPGLRQVGKRLSKFLE